MLKYSSQFTKKEYYFINVIKLQTIIKNELGVDVNIPYELDLPNFSYYSFIATDLSDDINALNEDDEPIEFDNSIYSIIDHLATIKAIPEGNILIEIFW